MQVIDRIQCMIGLCLWLLTGSMAMAQGLTESVQTEYLVQTRVFMYGELRGEPSLLVEAGKDARIENRSGGRAWALNVMVKAADAAEQAMDGAIWLELGVEEEVDGRWEFLADTMLGLPPGQTGTISVVDQANESEGPEHAQLLIEVTVDAVDDAQ
ncbi:MAG: hypothetical protein AAGH65_12420 [Pseudomonadota bacterium]